MISIWHEDSLHSLLFILSNNLHVIFLLLFKKMFIGNTFFQRTVYSFVDIVRHPFGQYLLNFYPTWFYNVFCYFIWHLYVFFLHEAVNVNLYKRMCWRISLFPFVEIQSIVLILNTLIVYIPETINNIELQEKMNVWTSIILKMMRKDMGDSTKTEWNLCIPYLLVGDCFFSYLLVHYRSFQLEKEFWQLLVRDGF